MINDREIRRYATSSGCDIFKLPVEAFTNHVTNCYLVLDDTLTLIDTGSSFPESIASLEACFERLREETRLSIGVEDVRRVILTHAHIDHFGGILYIAERSGAAIGIHRIDRSAIENFEERLIVASKNLHIYLDRAGLSDEVIEGLLVMHKWSKDIFHSAAVDFDFDEGPVADTPFIAHHTPGHCPGQVCLQLDDVLFVGDHVLSHITPNQAPEFITHNTGLGHYFKSLQSAKAIPGVRLALPGHEHAMEDFPARVDEILRFHQERLERTLEICAEPKTLKQISQELFGPREHYHILLALLETGAHVEYLHEHGRLTVVNIDEVEREPNPVLVYERRR